MKHWTRAKLNTLCGNCPTVIKPGEPLLELRGAGWCKVRCEDCAGEPVPSVIEDAPLHTRTIGPRFADRIASISGMAKDWKHAQGGDRND